MVEIQKKFEQLSNIKKYHIRLKPIIENPHNQPFKPEKKEVMKWISCRLSATKERIL